MQYIYARLYVAWLILLHYFNQSELNLNEYFEKALWGFLKPTPLGHAQMIWDSEV